MRDLHLHVGGMGCRHCVREVTARLRDVAGVERVVADATRNRVTLSGSMEADDVMRALSASPFTARIETDEPAAEAGSPVTPGEAVGDDRAGTAGGQGHR